MIGTDSANLRNVVARIDGDADKLHVFSCNLVCSRENAGISSRHGGHQVAQKLTTRGSLPCHWRSGWKVPVAVGSVRASSRVAALRTSAFAAISPGLPFDRAIFPAKKPCAGRAGGEAECQKERLPAHISLRCCSAAGERRQSGRVRAAGRRAL